MVWWRREFQATGGHCVRLALALALLGVAMGCGSRSSLTGYFDPGASDGGTGGVSVGSGGRAASGGAAGTGGSVGSGGTAVSGGASGSGGAGGEFVPPFRQFGTTQPDELFDVVVDPAGNIYVAGSTSGSLDAPADGGSAYAVDGILRKYSPAGDVLWTHQWGGYGIDFARSLTLDASGLLHVLFIEDSQSILMMLDAEGELYSDQLHGSDGVDLAVDAEGLRFLTRYVALSDGTFDVELTKLDSGGIGLWTVQLGAGPNDFPEVLAVLPNGDIALGGTTDGALFQPSQGFPEAFVARFSTDGRLLWGVQLPLQAPSYVSGLAADSEGRLYAAGFTPGDGDADGFVARVDADGTVAWVASYGTADATETFSDIVVDGFDQVTVSGTTSGMFGAAAFGELDAFAARIHPDGGLGDVLQFGTLDKDFSWGIAAAPDGAVFVVGGTTGAFEGVDDVGSPDAYLFRVAPF